MLPLFIAVQFLTRIPIRLSESPDKDDFTSSLIYFPLVGALIGSFIALIWNSFFYLGFSRSLSSAISIVAGLLLTGALHEDGTADTLDGFGGGKDRNDILRIMRDSQVGSFGSLGIILIVILRMSALETIDPSKMMLSLVLAHTWARFAAVTLTVISPAVQRDRLSTAMILCQNSNWTHLLRSWFVALCITYWISSSYFWVPIAITMVVVPILKRWYLRNIGGITGDCIGFCVVMIELLILSVCSLIFASAS